MTEDKTTLAKRRAELVALLATPMSPGERASCQSELSVINATIKALNTTEAAQLKAAADRRKAAGLAEFHANLTRSQATAGEVAVPEMRKLEDDDPAQANAIDRWFIEVLGDSGIAACRQSGSGTGISYGGDIPLKWRAVLNRLHQGLHALARGAELPDANETPNVRTLPPPKTSRSKKAAKKHG